MDTYFRLGTRAFRSAASSVAFLLGALGASSVSAQVVADAPGGFALVELFTSEGCHACPPADRLIPEIAETAEREEGSVYVLSYHVDYWDSYGWRDPFSLAEATRRQRAYAAAWHTSRVYTPQMVVNGTVGFVGSDRNRANREIRDAAGRRPIIEIRPSVQFDEDGAAVIRSAITDQATGKAVRITAAIVQRKASSDVTRGENRGRRLEHHNVVRAVGAVMVSDDAVVPDITLAWPAGLARDDAEIIVYAQDARSLRVLGAARSAMPAASDP